MKHQITEEQLLETLIGYVKDSRQYGATYIHSEVRDMVGGRSGMSVWVNGRDAVIKYHEADHILAGGQVVINYTDDGNPVPTKLLDRVFRSVEEAVAHKMMGGAL